MQLIFQVSSDEIGDTTEPHCKWSRDSKYLAVFGGNSTVSIFDRNGSKLSNFPVADPEYLDWDAQNKLLAISSQNSQEITIFNVETRDVTQITAPFCPTWLQFSANASFLSVTSDKGQYWIWESGTQQSQQYQGSHCEKIVSGAWNSKKQVAFCSEDQTISVNNVRGDIIAHAELSDIPAYPHYIMINGSLTLIFTAVNQPLLYVWSYTTKEPPTEITLPKKFGHIVYCRTLTNNLIYVQFSSGRMFLLDFDYAILYERSIFSTQVSSCETVGVKSIVCSGSSAKVITMIDSKNVTEEQTPFESRGECKSLSFTQDGSIAAFCLTTGDILVYLVEVPMLVASRGPFCAYADSLTSLSYTDMHKKKSTQIRVEAQPQKIAICKSKLAVSFNDTCWFYSTSDSSQIHEIKLSNSIDSIEISDTAYAILSSGHVILAFFDESKKPFEFPDFDTQIKVTAFALTECILVIACDDGSVRILNTRNLDFLTGYKHSSPIISITPNLSETRFLFIDSTHSVFLFNPTTLTVLSPTTNSDNGSNSKTEPTTALFDISDRNVFATIGAGGMVDVYHFTDHNVDGPQLKLLCSQRVMGLRGALGISNGTITYLDSQSNEQIDNLDSHKELSNNSPEAVRQLIALHRHRRALQIALELNDKSLIHEIAESAMGALCIEIATEAYTACGEGSKSNISNMIRFEEEYKYLRGFVAMLNGDFNSAQKNFLDSTRPEMALDMRASLQQFDFALHLAETLDPSRIPFLSLESGRQKELTGNYSDAIKDYMRAKDEKSCSKAAKYGIIKCLLQAGKVEHGLKMLQKVNDRKLLKECGQILEKLGAYTGAAGLYEKVNEYDSAGQCYLRGGELKSAANLIPKLSDAKVLRSIGVQLEREGQLETAAEALQRGNDWESVVRVLLKVNLDRATAIARQHPTATVCRLVAEHCVNLGNFNYAIEFLIREGRSDDAFKIAELHSQVDVFAKLIGDDGNKQQYEAIAKYFDSHQQLMDAGKFYGKAGYSGKALRCYMKDGSDAAMDAALDLAEKISDTDLRNNLLQFLTDHMNKENGKDFKYLMRMFIIMQHFDEAAQTGLSVSDQLRSNGEYKASRDLIFDVILQLSKYNFPISAELKHSLILGHSYLLVNNLKKENPHYAALLLKRISNWAGKFPKHAAAILQMGLVECYKVGMKKTAFEIGKKLLQPEYEGKMSSEMKKKVEKTVMRKNTDEIEEPVTKCPICGTSVPVSELVCGSCKSALPFDSLTGMHMTRDDWCECPKCHYPASYKLMCKERACPLCGESIPNPILISEPKI